MTEVNVTTEVTNVTVNPLGKIQVVAVVFNESGHQKEYHYFAPETARAGDYAVVYQSANGTDFPFKVVKIARDNVIDVNGLATKSIWGTFNEEFAKAVQERTEQLARVKSLLAQKKRAFEEKEVYIVMAQTDPEVAALLKELNGFGL